MPPELSVAWAKPPPQPTLGTGELHIWQANLGVGQHALQELEAHLNSDERERAARFAFSHDRDRFVAARGWLRRLLARYVHVQPEELRFGYTAYGKPFLTAPETGARLGFNLAHSGDLALYALIWERQVGVDLERIRHDLEYTTLIPSIFSAHEQHALATLPDDQRRLAFFNGWARKEAYLKARGEGLSYAPNSFDVSLFPGEPAMLHLPPEASDERWSLHALDPGADYAAAVVIEGDATYLRLYTA